MDGRSLGGIKQQRNMPKGIDAAYIFIERLLFEKTGKNLETRQQSVMAELPTRPIFDPTTPMGYNEREAFIECY